MRFVIFLLTLTQLGLGQSGFKNINFGNQGPVSTVLQPAKKVPGLSNHLNTNEPSEIRKSLRMGPLTSIPALSNMDYLDQSSFWAQSDQKVSFNLRAANSSVFAFLHQFKDKMKVQDVTREFEYQSTETDDLGMQHIKVRQVYKGIPVYGGDIIIHGKNNIMNQVNGTVYATPTDLDIHATLPIAQVETLIKADLMTMGKDPDALLALDKPSSRKLFSSEEIIFYDKNKKAHLAYAVSIIVNGFEQWEYRVDAHTGEIIKKYKNLCTFLPIDQTSFLSQNNAASSPKSNHISNYKFDFDGKATSQAIDLQGRNLILNTYLDAGRYYLVDATRAMFKTIGADNEEPIGVIWTFDGHNRSPANPRTFNSNLINSTSNSGWISVAAASAHQNAGLAYEYYLNKHNRNSINGRGGNILSFINVAEDDGTSMDNAFWDGESMYYGNGKDAFTPLAKALDVAGHEMSHGVIQATANLDYESESGALNESFADIFGRLIDRDDWLIGEDVVKKSVFPTGALRSFIDPHNGGNQLNDNGYQPRIYLERYEGTKDNGGVHINSGINNWAFYKYATSINDLDKAEKVYYRTLTRYLTRSSRFIDCRKAVIQSATDLYGASSLEVAAAKAAYDAVGILDGASTPTQTDVVTNPGTDFIIFTDDAQSALYMADGTGKLISNPLSSKPPLSRASVTDDGSGIIFVGKDKKIHYIIIDWAQNKITETGVLQSDPIWRNAVISKDGNRVAAIKDIKENKIHVFDYTIGQSGEWRVFDLYNPTYSTGKITGAVDYADAMEFDHTSQEIMYDAQSTIRNSSGVDIVYWDISFLRVFDGERATWADGKIAKLFSQLPEKTSVGNATFSKNSPHIIAMDMLIEGATASQTTYLLLGGNTETGTLDTIFVNGQLCFPNFSTADDRVLFNANTNSNTKVLGQIKVDKSKISPVGFATALVQNAKLGVWFANGERTITTSAKDDLAKRFGARLSPNPVATDLITLQWKQPSSIKTNKIGVYDLMGKMVWSANKKFGAGDQSWSIPVDKLQAGMYVINLTLDGIGGSLKFIKQ